MPFTRASRRSLAMVVPAPHRRRSAQCALVDSQCTRRRPYRRGRREENSSDTSAVSEAPPAYAGSKPTNVHSTTEYRAGGPGRAFEEVRLMAETLRRIAIAGAHDQVTVYPAQPESQSMPPGDGYRQAGRQRQMTVLFGNASARATVVESWVVTFADGFSATTRCGAAAHARGARGLGGRAESESR